MARIRDDGDKLIELFAEVALPKDASTEAFILRTYPLDYSNKEILNSVPNFAYPCNFRCDVVTHFSFVLTNINSKWTFGYCRHTPKSDTCLVILSDLPWHSTFYRILDHCAELAARQSSIPLERFLEALYTSDLPQPGLELSVTYTCEDIKLREFKVPCPDHLKLPCIPEDRNVTEYFSAVNATNMIAIFAAMLNERRIVITSDRLTRLSACVQAANALIYPMNWQHIFIPLLPSHLLDYLSAPMPFLIGVPQVTLAKVKRNELGDIVLLNADSNQLTTPFDDVSTLPSEVLHNLRKALKQSSASLGDGLCRAFMRALVSLIGGYRAALRIVPGEQITFNKEVFVSSVRGTSRQLFLEKMLQLQIFQQFIETRLDLFNAGQRLDDQFEIELNHMETQSGNRFKTQYREWASTMRKEGGALLRAVNPKVKSAISKSRQAVRNLRSIISNDSTQMQHRPTSAPSSPKLPPKIKKSISGTAISQTSRTVTYVRTPNAVSTSAPISHKNANRMSTLVTSSGGSSTNLKAPLTSSQHNGYNTRTTLVPPNMSLAPSASSESSDVDETDSGLPPVVVARVDMNITAELENIFRNKAVLNGGSSHTLPATSSNKPFTNAHTVSTDVISGNFTPIPPPRIDKFANFTRHSLKPATLNTGKDSSTLPSSKPTPNIAQEKCLIEFDSPPKDIPPTSSDSNTSSLGALMFDPLLEANYSSSQTLPQTTRNEQDKSNLLCFEANNNNNTNNLFMPTNRQLGQLPMNGLLSGPAPVLFPNNFGLEQTNAATGYNTSNLISRFELLSSPKQAPSISALAGGPAGSAAPVTTGARPNHNPFQAHWQNFD